MPESIKKGTFLNLVAYGLSGIFLFIFKIITARSLGKEAFGIISVFLASIWIISRLLTTGIKDSATRYISLHEATEDRKGMSRVFLENLKYTIVVILFFLFLSLSLFKILSLQLFSGFLTLYILFVLSCILYFVLFFLRGVLQGLRELKDSAVSVIVEYFTMLLALVAFFSFAKDVRFAALSILLAPLCSLLYILSTISKHRKRFSNQPSQVPTTRTLLRFVIPTSFVNFSSGFITQLGPPFIKIVSNFSLAGVFTASLDIFKAARTALTALFISIFPHLSRQEALKNKKRLHVMIRDGLIFVLTVSVIMVVVSITFGQRIVEFFYGEKFVIARVHLLLMSLFTSFFLLSELFNRILLAKSMLKALSFSWVCAIMILIGLLFLPCSPLIRAEVALLGAAITAFCGMIISLMVSKTSKDV